MKNKTPLIILAVLLPIINFCRAAPVITVIPAGNELQLSFPAFNDKNTHIGDIVDEF